MKHFLYRAWTAIRNLFRKKKKTVVPLPEPEKDSGENISNPEIKLTPMQMAESEIGVTEIVGKKHNDRVLWYHSFTSLKAVDDETPWCSSFVCAIMESCGFESTKSAAARSWETWGEKGAGKRGEIVVFSRGSNPKHGHVGFLARDYKEGDNYLHVLGGNQGNAVCIMKYPASRWIASRKYL